MSSAYLRLLIFLPAILIMVVKVVSGDSELKMEVYISASDKKECLGEKWERMGLKIGLPIPGKLRGWFKKDKCRRINIKGLGKISERTLWNQHWFKSAFCLMLRGYLEKRERIWEGSETPKGILCQKMSSSIFSGLLVTRKPVSKGPRKCWNKCWCWELRKNVNLFLPVFPMRGLITHDAPETASVKK